MIETHASGRGTCSNKKDRFVTVQVRSVNANGKERFDPKELPVGHQDIKLEALYNFFPTSDSPFQILAELLIASSIMIYKI
jgi:hypothetical protein